jgi:C4-dicarboxylate-specific signal transduction histidine kinase
VAPENIQQAMNPILKPNKAQARKVEIPAHRVSRPGKRATWAASVTRLVMSLVVTSLMRRARRLGDVGGERVPPPDLPLDEACLHDMEERKRAEPFTLLSQPCAYIAHEVSQPLGAIVANGEACLHWLNREAPQYEEAAACVQRIIDEGRRASEIVRCIRALAATSAPQQVRLELNDVVNDVVPLVRHEVSNHGVSLRLRLAPGLPPLLGDRVQLQQVFINLILNGIQAMADIANRPRELLIESRLDASGFVIVAVRDSGAGIAPEHVCRLFDAFFTTKRGGMGIGLAICRSIIEEHRGMIVASNNAGHGATFQCRLPAIDASAHCT